MALFSYLTNSNHSDRSAGFSLMESILAVAVVSIIFLGYLTLAAPGMESQRSGERLRALALAQEAIEAVRNLREVNISKLETHATQSRGLRIAQSLYNIEHLDPKPAGNGQAVAFSPDGNYIAVAHEGSPFLSLYVFNSATAAFGTKFIDHQTEALPGIGRAVAFSPNSKYLAVAHDNTPFMTVYTIDTVAKELGAKLSNPATLLPAKGNGIAFAAGGAHLAVAHDSTPYFSVYNFDQTNGTIGTRLTPPVEADLPPGHGFGIAFSPANKFIALGGDHNEDLDGKYLNIYKFNSGASTITTRYAATTTANVIRGVAFNPAATYLGVAHSASPFVTVYNFNENSAGNPLGTKLANPSTLPTGIGRGVTFSHNNSYIAVAHDSSPFLSVYNFSSSFGSKLANPSTLPPNTGKGIAFFPSTSSFIALAHDTSPFISVYNFSSVFGTKLVDPQPVTQETITMNGVTFTRKVWIYEPNAANCPSSRADKRVKVRVEWNDVAERQVLNVELETCFQTWPGR